MEINNSPSFSTMSTPAKSGGEVVERNNSSSNLSREVPQKQQEKTTQSMDLAGMKTAEKSNTNENQAAMRDEMMALAREMNRNLNPLSTSVRFEFGEEIGGLYINVIDATTDSVIRRFPSEQAVELSIKMKEIVGMMFDKRI